MGNLFGHKKWYKVDKIIKDKKGKESTIKQEVRIKRNYSVDRYTLNTNNKEKNNINNEDFVNQFIEYKTNNDIFKKFTRKFHMGNILFKLKAKELKNKTVLKIRNYSHFLETEKVVLEIEIYQQSEKLIEEENITKKDIIDKAIKEKVTEDSNEIKMQIKTKENKSKEIKISINKETEEYHIKLKSINNNELNLKREIYEILKSINANLYIITENAINNADFKKRNYENFLRENIMEHLKKNIREKSKMTFLKSLSNSLKKIQGNIKKNDEIINFIKYYSNINGSKTVSENKKNFLEKILNTEVSISENDIIDFIIGELKFFGIIKRIEKLQEKTVNRTDGDIKNTYVNTYVLLDKHEKFKKYNRNKKDTIIKSFIKNIKDNTMKQKINQILRKFKIEELIEKLRIKNKNFDTEIFKIFKDHYQEMFSSEKFEKKSDEEKELYKIIYRYLKGRIEKILVNKQKVRLKKIEKIEIEKILNESILSEKILKRVKQYTLEHIMYLGKLRHNDIVKITVNTDDFSRLHAKEELDLELITFFASTNMELNKIFNGKEKVTDFFGFNLNGQKITLKEKVPSFKLNILKKLNFINNENNIDEKLSHFYSFQKEGYLLRNKILHNSYGNIQETKNLKGEYENVEKLIKELKVSDEEISKSLSLDVIFEGKVDIINKINSLKIGEYKDKKYLPSFSKIVPEITRKFREINKDKLFDIESEKIILNAVKYVNKILYEKITSNEENEFLKTLPDKLVKKSNNKKENKNLLSIEEYYKNAQVSSSKGDKKAIKKYQNKVTNAYLEYLENTFTEIIDFSKFNLNYDEIKTKIEERKDNKSKIIIDSISTNINITNDIEYIISIFALLNSNTYINKIRNRFFATSVWLEKQNGTKEYDYENIISILDEVLLINLLRENNITDILDLKNAIIDAKIVENDETYIKNYIFESNEEKLKKGLFCEEFVDKEDIRKIFEDENFKFKNFIKKNEIGNFKINFGVLYNLECNSEVEVKKIIGQNSKKLESFIQNTIDEYKSNIRTLFSSEFLEKYKEEIDNLVEDTESENKNKFEKIYYPKEHKNELYIYKKNLFLNIGNPNFDKIYGLISKDIKNVDTKILFDDNIRKNKISEIDAILKNLNDKLNGYSNDYKAKYVNKLKENDDFFAKNIQNENYSSFGEFEKDYNKVSEYKKIRDLVEFNYLNKIESYLIDINWKLAIQMARFERDMHYIVNGLRELGIIKLSGYNTGISRAYPKRNGSDGFYTTTAYYKFFDEESYKKFEKICYGFGIDLSENSEINKPENESIRNYISHFYIVRNPFVDYSIAEQIDRVSNLLSYSTRYNNSTYASVFEVFKKDVDLNYDELKKKFKLIGNNNILEKLMRPKKVSVLELESYNSGYIKNLIIKLLTKIENTNDTL